jgi:glycosyltransferase 2 family protein
MVKKDLGSAREAVLVRPEKSAHEMGLELIPGRNLKRYHRGQAARALIYAPQGDGKTRRRASDGIRVVLAALAVVVCWLAVRASSHAEHSIAKALSPPPNGVSWLVTTVWWAGTAGVMALMAMIALSSRRWQVIRDVLCAAAAALAVVLLLRLLLGADGGRPANASVQGIDPGFPVLLLAVSTAVVLAMLPYLSRWLQVSSKIALILVSVAAIVHGSGFPVAVLASLAVGWGCTAAVRLTFGSPVGLPSVAEVLLLLEDLAITATSISPSSRQEWGVGRFTAKTGTTSYDVSIYGRDASDAQLLSKTFRFLLYRDSGPTLALTRRQQVEHEALLTMTARRTGARVPAVVTVGPAGPANDAVLVTTPPHGRPLSCFASYRTDRPNDGDKDGSNQTTELPPSPSVPTSVVDLDDEAIESIFTQVRALRAGGLAHGSLSTETIVVDDRAAGFIDFRTASLRATQDQLDRDIAGALAAAALVVGPTRTAQAAIRVLSGDDVAAALPFLQRAALDPVAARTLRQKKALLADLRVECARVAGVEVPKLIEPRRISWVNVFMVLGTLIGGWALIGVLTDVTQSWSTIQGANWAWVVLVFVLAQSAYPAIAMTTVGSVTTVLPYGRTLALEVSNTFVALAGGSMAVLATRIRFFQKQGYDATVAVSSGVLVSTASWIVKGALFLIALPIAWGNLHLSEPSSNGKDHAQLVWIIVLIVVIAGVVVGLAFAVPRWRNLAAEKLRPKVSEVWSHLKILAAHPRNLVEIFGGNVIAQVVIALALGASLHAFGDHLDLATLIVVLTLASMLGGVSPVPGGMGVVEAGMILGLTAAGISQTDAVAATFVQRLFTAYLPPIWGWFVLVWLRKKDYL